MGPFQVCKTVRGNFADMDKDFPFSISMELPELVPYGYRNLITARVYRNGSFNRTVTMAFDQYERTAAATFVLRHNEEIRFVNVPYGTEFTVIEDFQVYYGQEAIAYRAGERTQAQSYFQTGTDPLRVIGSVRQRVVGGAVVTGNWVEVTNDQDAVAPMGVFARNAPFIGLMAFAAISGAIGFMKLRKREDEYEYVAYE